MAGAGVGDTTDRVDGSSIESLQWKTNVLQAILDTKLLKDHVRRGQFSPPLPSHLCSLISMTYDPQNKIESMNIINIPKIGALRCPTNPAQIPVYREASLLR
jgi:hypothetical protein